ncbi:MAG: hypothetical protein ACE5F9_10000 [Phycisphaerae bacterium]
MKLTRTLCTVPMAVCMSGCTTAGSRNIKEAVSVASRPSLTEKDVRFILELRQNRTEIALSDVDEFLSGPESAHVGYSVKADLKHKKRKLQETLAKAIATVDAGCAVTRPDPEHAFTDDNIVVYLRGREGCRVYFSYGEIDALFAYPEVTEDLATVRYTNPLFETGTLDLLKASLKERHIETPNLALPEGRLKQLKSLAAAGVLERKLRSLDVPLTGDTLLLASGLFVPRHSPKLTDALGDKDVLERVLSCGEPNVIRALVYLINNDVVELSSL